MFSSTNDGVGVAVGIVVGGGGASATAVDIAAGNAVTADNDNAVYAVVPPSSTKDEDAYVGALCQRIRGWCRCRRGRAVALPPLPQPPCCCHRAAAIALCPAAALRAAATTADAVMLPPTLRCHAVATAGLIGRGGRTLLSSAQSIVDYLELCMGGGMIYRSP